MKLTTCPTCGQRIRSKNEDRHNRATAIALFNFWRFVMNKPNSHDSETYIKKIMDRLKDGYSHLQLAHAIMGISLDPWHIKNRLFHIEYAIRSGEKIDKLIDSAEMKGISESKVEQRYDWFSDRLSEGKSIHQIILEFRQNSTNNGNLNPNTGAKLF